MASDQPPGEYTRAVHLPVPAVPQQPLDGLGEGVGA